MKRFTLCGACAAEFVAAGGRQVHATIYMGAPCEAHPTSFPAQAVAVVEADAVPPRPSSETLLGARPDPETIPSIAAPPTSPGAVLPAETEIATRLLVAWTEKSEGAKADDLMVGHAVNVARKLLRATEGR